MSEQPETYAAAAEVGAVRKRRTAWERFVLLMKSAPPSAWFGMIVVSLYILVAIFADVLAPYGEAEIHPVPFAPWSDEFVFGTDQIGRDVLTRLIYGARNTMGIALATTFLSFLIGGGLGLVAAGVWYQLNRERLKADPVLIHSCYLWGGVLLVSNLVIPSLA